MLTESQIAQFKENGYINGGPAIGNAEVDILRDELKRVIEHYDELEHKPVQFVNLGGKNEAPVWQIINIWEASEPYRALMGNRKIVEEIAQLTGASELRVWHDQIQYKPAQVGGVNMWHQDAPLWPTIEPMTEVSAWVALDDVDEGNGCMTMIPGSHQWGAHTYEFLIKLPDFESLPEEFQEHQVVRKLCPVRKGEVHYHHALTWHGSHANTSGRPRRAIAIHYMAESTRFVGNRGHIMEPLIDLTPGDLMSGAHFPLVYP